MVSPPSLVCKRDGFQMSEKVESITIYPFEVKEEGSFTAEENLTPFKNKYEIKYQLANEYVMTYTLTNQ